MSRNRGGSSSPEDNRGRPTERYTSDGLSSFYRERFGSHSPEEYMNLRISGFDDKLERDEIKEILSSEFRKFAPFEIKVVRNPGDDERLAYVNFERRDCARKVRYTMMERLRKALGRRVLCDPAGILRDQEGKYIPDRFNRALQGDRSTGKRSPERRTRPKEPNQWRLKENESDATRTLFVGNMPADIRENEIRKVFERYGKIEDIDIKTPANTDAAYAFVMFQTLEQAMDAKDGEHDRSIRTGSTRCKIGFGKSQVSRRLWVGGLGSWTSSDILAKEFDRYGPIEKLDYEDGDEFAYIRFADVNAAQDACRGMKNFPLGGKDRCIMVDYAKDNSKDTGTVFARKRRATKSPPGGLRTPPGSPKPIVKTHEDLDEEYAMTWQGQVLLKKNEYNVRLYRVAGAEKLLQKLMRDEDGNSLKLHVTQRIALGTQEGLLERLTSTSTKQVALMMAVGKQIDEIRPLVRYLAEKDAAGVVSVPDGILYIFPNCNLSNRLLSHFSPNIRMLTEGCPYLLFALGIKAPSTGASPSR